LKYKDVTDNAIEKLHCLRPCWSFVSLW